VVAKILAAPFSIIILIKRDDAGRVRVGWVRRIYRVVGVETGAGAFLFIFIPEIAAFPNAVTQAGDRADGGSVVSHFFLWQAVPPYMVLFNLIFFSYVMSSAQDLLLGKSRLWNKE
jgi:hypothetical protein